MKLRTHVIHALFLALIGIAIAGCQQSTSPTVPNTGAGVTGSLYVTLTDFTQGGVLARIDLATGQTTTLVRGEAPNALSDKRIVALLPTFAGDLSIISPDGAQKQTILSTAFSPNFKKSFRDPQVSPDGRYIAYSNLGDGGGSYVYVIDLSGNLLLTIGNGADQQFLRPVWAPNGDLYMQGEPNTSPGIYKLAVNATVLTRIDPDIASPSEPSVSPDGSKLAFVVGDHVWTMNVDGSAAHQLTTSSWRESYPTWSPDSKWVAVYDGSNDIELVSMTTNTVVAVSTLLADPVFNTQPPARSSQMDWK